MSYRCLAALLGLLLVNGCVNAGVKTGMSSRTPGDMQRTMNSPGRTASDTSPCGGDVTVITFYDCDQHPHQASICATDFSFQPCQGGNPPTIIIYDGWV